MASALSVLIQYTQTVESLWSCFSFEISTEYGVPGCETHSALLHVSQLPKVWLLGCVLSLMPLDFFSLSPDPFSSPKHPLCPLVASFLQHKQNVLLVILSSDVTLDRGSLGTLQRDFKPQVEGRSIRQTCLSKSWVWLSLMVSVGWQWCWKWVLSQWNRKVFRTSLLNYLRWRVCNMISLEWVSASLELVTLTGVKASPPPHRFSLPRLFPNACHDVICESLVS